MTPSAPSEPSGSWDSIHVFEAAERGRQAHYKLTSTIMLQLVTHKGGKEETEGEPKRQGSSDSQSQKGWSKEGEVSLSGSMTRQVGHLIRFLSGYIECGSSYYTVGTGLASPGLGIAHHEHRQNDRGDGDQNA